MKSTGKEMWAGVGVRLSVRSPDVCTAQRTVRIISEYTWTLRILTWH